PVLAHSCLFPSAGPDLAGRARGGCPGNRAGARASGPGLLPGPQLGRGRDGGMVQTRVTPPAESPATNPGRKSRLLNGFMDCIAHGTQTHSSCRCPPAVLIGDLFADGVSGWPKTV